MLLFFLFAFINKGQDGLLRLSCHPSLFRRLHHLGLLPLPLPLSSSFSSSSPSLSSSLLFFFNLCVRRSVYIIVSIIVFYINKHSILWLHHLGRSPRNGTGCAG